MEINNRGELVLHLEILLKQTRKAFDFLSAQIWLSQENWYLAGGTALALQAGNRKSVDLDFFTTQADLEADEIMGYFRDNKDWETDINSKNTIYGRLFDAKISFIAYPFFIPKQDYIRYGTINILQPLDIAVMKIIAISQRGKKRDFFDLYWSAHHVEPLEQMIKRLPEQYPSVAHDYHHILKSLVYFEDAETDPDPEIYFKANWDIVKDFFTKEVPVITRKIMKLN